ncbi:MAG TPA: hypothetical protein VNI54_02660 [Thermoanaerobaculia bacterium]|nr:hypothetical protein [Thermoanaerobaculia bacterium]
MKRGVFDVLRRGLDNAIANWGLIVIRFVEIFALAAIAVAAALAMLVPILVSIGIDLADFRTPDQMDSALLTLLDKWVMLIWIFIGLCVLTLVLVALHSVVAAGCARVAVDADRAAGPAQEGPRSRYHVFSMSRWWTGARDGWWTVFWIYNFAWGVAGLILLIPLLPTLVLTIVFRDEPAVAISSGCIGLALSVMLMIVVGVVTGIWTNRAIADWAAQGTGASTSLSGAWGAIKADLGRHVLIAVVMIVVAIAGSSLFSTFSFFATFGETMHRTMAVSFFTIPLRVLGTALNWAFSGFVGSWMFAAYAALAVERFSSHGTDGTYGT